MMKKLYYNIYDNITDSQFFKIEKRLLVIECMMLDLLKGDGWYMKRSVVKNDALIIDFLNDDAVLAGNMGIVFEDSVNQIDFTFYVTKSFDENNVRYFLRNDLFTCEPLSYFENDIEHYTSQAIELFSSISKTDIIKRGITVDLENGTISGEI